MPGFLPSRERSAPAIARPGARYSHAPPVEAGPLSGAILPQRAVRPRRVRPGEDPVLPRRQPPEDLGLERVRAEAAPLLDRDADLLRPVDVVGREGDQAQPLGILGLQ